MLFEHGEVFEMEELADQTVLEREQTGRVPTRLCGVVKWAALRSYRPFNQSKDMRHNLATEPRRL